MASINGDDFIISDIKNGELTRIFLERDFSSEIVCFTICTKKSFFF